MSGSINPSQCENVNRQRWNAVAAVRVPYMPHYYICDWIWMIIACSYCLLFVSPFTISILHPPPSSFLLPLFGGKYEIEWERTRRRGEWEIEYVCVCVLVCLFVCRLLYFAFHFGWRLISFDKSELGALICAKCVIKYQMCVSRLS